MFNHCNITKIRILSSPTGNFPFNKGKKLFIAEISLKWVLNMNIYLILFFIE